MKLKRTLLFVLASLAFLSVNADRQKVYSFIKQEQSQEWYKEQSELWSTYLKTNKQDADAWLNYYTAMRMIRVSGGDMDQKKLDKIVIDARTNVPNSFESHYMVFWNASFEDLNDNFHHLEKAHEISPNRAELYDEFLTYYEMKRDKTKLKEVARKWYASNDMPSGLYYWGYNVLQSLEPNAILITSGDNDTYPVWVMQYAKGIRSDVNVLNHSLIGVTSYRDKYFKELGIPKMPFTKEGYETFPSFQTAMMRYIKKNTNRPIYFAISAHPHLYKEFKDDIYNVGMAYKWSEEKFDNIAVLKKNYEKNYLIDYLKFNPTAHVSNNVVDHMNANYLISLLPLYNHYLESEDVRANEVEQLINKIARKNNMETRVAKILGKAKSGVTSYVIKDPRALEKGIVRIKDKLYAGETEVFNAQYELFLTDLLKQKRYDDLSIAKATAVNWRSLLPEKYAKLTDKEIFPNGHSNEGAYPVVNISFEAAQMYCAWLTEVYNSLEYKRKKFSEVEFRLPTKQEWEYMALGGKKKTVYPWGGPHVRNAKGCFLANVKAQEQDAVPNGGVAKECSGSTCAIDGGTFPVAVHSYFPNDYGLYNMTGNVSEMTSEKGVVKGGSWNTPAEKATIENEERINAPSPEVGFRVIMIVK